MTTSEILVTQKEKATIAKVVLAYSSQNSISEQLIKQITFDNFLVETLTTSENDKQAFTLTVAQNTLLLQYCLRGHLVIKDTAQQKSTKFNTNECNVILLNEGSWSLNLNDDDCNLIQIYLSEGFFYRYIPNEESESLTTLNKSGKLFSKNLFLTPKLKSILDEIQNCDFGGTLKNLYTRAKIIELLTLQIAQHDEEKTIPSTLKPLEVEKMIVVKELIESNLAESYTISALARAAGTNEQYLKKHFKQLYGSTVFGYMISCKMEKAKEMLMSGKYRITEIAELVGYKHATHFTSAFKKFFGCLPQSFKTKVLWGGYFVSSLKLETLEMLVFMKAI